MAPVGRERDVMVLMLEMERPSARRYVGATDLARDVSDTLHVQPPIGCLPAVVQISFTTPQLTSDSASLNVCDLSKVARALNRPSEGSRSHHVEPRIRHEQARRGLWI
jgi:hypothetical protein